MTQQYETVCVLRADTTSEEMEALDSKLQKVFADHKVTDAEKRDWGQRRLAYPIQKETSGHYYQWVFTGGGTLISDLERQLGYNDKVLRYLTIKIEKETQRDTKPDDYQFGKIDWQAIRKPVERRRRTFQPRD